MLIEKLCGHFYSIRCRRTKGVAHIIMLIIIQAAFVLLTGCAKISIHSFAFTLHHVIRQFLVMLFIYNTRDPYCSRNIELHICYIPVSHLLHMLHVCYITYKKSWLRKTFNFFVGTKATFSSLIYYLNLLRTDSTICFLFVNIN
jgi:hypothetical protein